MAGVCVRGCGTAWYPEGVTVVSEHGQTHEICGIMEL